MPKEKAYLQFQKWAEIYGPVYSLILGTKVMVVLNTDVAVKDLLDKRSAIYSSRPDLYIARIASGGWRFSLMVSLAKIAGPDRTLISNHRSTESCGARSARSCITLLTLQLPGTMSHIRT